MLTKGKIEVVRTIALVVGVIAICATLIIVPQKCIPDTGIPEGKVLIDQSFLDSLKAVAEMPPDTTFVEKIVVKDTTIYIVKSNPTPIYIDLPGNQRVYVDSVKMLDDGINAWVKLKTRGVLEELTWGYKPVFKTITQEIRIPEPYPVDVFKKIPQRGLFLNGGVGGGSGMAGFSLGLSWQQRNGLTYGAQMIQFDQRYYMLKIGYKIF